MTVVGLAVGALLTGLVLPALVDEEAGTVSSSDAVRSAGPAPGAAALDAEPSPDVDGSGAGAGDDLPPAGELGSQPPTAAAGAATTVLPGPNAPTAAATGPRRASDVGVTPEAVKLGVLIFETGAAGRAGFGVPGSEPPAQRRFWESYVADVNDVGGIHGRKVVPAFVSFDAVDEEDQARACVAMAEDVKPFAVTLHAGFGGDATLCLTERYRLPMLSPSSEPAETIARTGGRFFATAMASDVHAASMVRTAERQGRLRDATIAVMMSEDAPSRIPGEKALLPALKELGHEVVHVTRFAPDLATTQSQIPVEIAEMRRKGVDRVVSVADSIRMGLWFNQAESQGFRPLYLLSDVQAAANDFTVQAAPPALEAIGYTIYRTGESRAGRPVHPVDADCHERYRRRTGQAVERDSIAWQAMTAICGQVATFVRGATAAGPELTRSGWAAAMAALPPFEFPNVGGPLTFGRAKFDGPNAIRTKRFSSSCRCFVPIDDFVAIR